MLLSLIRQSRSKSARKQPTTGPCPKFQESHHTIAYEAEYVILQNFTTDVAAGSDFGIILQNLVRQHGDKTKAFSVILQNLLSNEANPSALLFDNLALQRGDEEAGFRGVLSVHSESPQRSQQSWRLNFEELSRKQKSTKGGFLFCGRKGIYAFFFFFAVFFAAFFAFFFAAMLVVN